MITVSSRIDDGYDSVKVSSHAPTSSSSLVVYYSSQMLFMQIGLARTDHENGRHDSMICYKQSFVRCSASMCVARLNQNFHQRCVCRHSCLGNYVVSYRTATVRLTELRIAFVITCLQLSTDVWFTILVQSLVNNTTGLS